jgi:hypothetical protein
MADDDDYAETIICANPDCRVAETHRCVEGLDLGACPHYGREPDVQGAEAEPVSDDESREGVCLPGAGTLSTSEASSVLRRGRARVIAVIGPSDSGKTSLIASLYDLFQEGAVADVEFARSRTLHAFEHTCHDARAMSRRGVPHMNRTPIGEVSFYHLEIGGGPAGDGLALLLGDRAGEEYRAAADDVAVVADFSEVVRADTLTVLVDGVRLLSAGARHNLRSDILMMLQGLQDGGGLRAESRLALVLTKLDAVREAETAERALRDFDGLLADARRLFGGALAAIESFQVAASPKTDVLPRGTGLAELLGFWLQAIKPFEAPAPELPPFKRAFSRLRPHEEEAAKEAHD